MENFCVIFLFSDTFLGSAWWFQSFFLLLSFFHPLFCVIFDDSFVEEEKFVCWCCFASSSGPPSFVFQLHSLLLCLPELLCFVILLCRLSHFSYNFQTIQTQLFFFHPFFSHRSSLKDDVVCALLNFHANFSGRARTSWTEFSSSTEKSWVRDEESYYLHFRAVQFAFVQQQLAVFCVGSVFGFGEREECARGICENFQNFLCFPKKEKHTALQNLFFCLFIQFIISLSASPCAVIDRERDVVVLKKRDMWDVTRLFAHKSSPVVILIELAFNSSENSWIKQRATHENW